MPEPAPPRGSILGFDFGQRRIGIAVGQATTRTASSLQTVACGQSPDWDAIDRVVADWRPELFVIGLPLDADGGETEMSRAARRFGKSLAERYGRECTYADERMSSLQAGSRFAEGRAAGVYRRKHAGRLDAMAAQVILENWLQSAPES